MIRAEHARGGFTSNAALNGAPVQSKGIDSKNANLNVCFGSFNELV
jgi:hypothetical protein